MTPVQLLLTPTVIRAGQVRRRLALVWRAHWDSARHRRRHFLRAWVGLVVLMIAVPLAQMALAEDGDAPAGAMGHLTATDSHGYEAWRYELNIDEGQMHRAQEKIPAALLLKWLWDFYRLCVADALRLVEIILNFEFVTWLEGPAALVEQTLSDVIDQIGVWGLLLTISAFLAGFWMLKGRSGVAISQVLIACLIASLGQNHLSDPVGLLTGPDGALTQSQQFGQAVTAEMLSNDPDAPVQVDENGQIDKAITASLVDTFIREPHQMVNYGASFDRLGKEDCVNAYNDGLAKAPWGRESGWRVSVAGACGEEYKEVAINPAGSIMAVIAIAPAGILLTLITLVLAIGLFLAVAWALFEATLLCLRLLQATLPGAARGSLWESLGTIAMAVVVCAVALLMLAITVLLITAGFKGTQSQDPFAAFIIIDLLLAVIVVITWRVVMGTRKKGKKIGDALHKATSPQPQAIQSGTRWGGGAAAASMAASAASSMRRSSVVAAGVGYGAARVADEDGPTSQHSGTTGAGSAGGGSGQPRPTPRGWGHKAFDATKTAGKVGFNYTAGAPVTVTRKVRAVSAATARYRAHKAEQLDRQLNRAQAYKKEYAQSVRTIRNWSRGRRGEAQ